MVNSTLGGLIKDYRLQKGVSQLDIAFSLGWKEPSRLCRIEQGKTEKPPRELLDRILTTIGLQEDEKNTILLTGGYLPTEEEIIAIKKETSAMIHQWLYPAVLYDFSWRILDANKHSLRVYQQPSDLGEGLYKSGIRILDILFNMPEDHLAKNETDLIILRNALAEFKYEQKNRTKEKWYIEHVKNLMDNKLFRKLWVGVDNRSKLDDVVGKYTIKQLLHPQDHNKRLNFYMFVVPVLKDPRFEIELLVPKDLETYTCYQ